ncbi:MAG TPA: hypothetical protein VFZ47_12370 [Chitinophagaceae bacterium]
MKKIFLALICATSIFVLRAQTSDAEAEAIVNLLGVQKKEAIAKMVSVTGKDSVAFWKLYDAYQNENRQLAKNRIRLYEQTARAYGNMNAGTADSLAKKYFENRLVQEKNLEDYYKKIKSATSAITAFEFYQAEVYLLTQIRASIMQQIPTYGEFKAAVQKKN